MEKGQIISDSGRTAQVLMWNNNCVLKLFRDGYTLAHVQREEHITRARKIIEPLIQRTGIKEYEKALENLKSILEQAS
jgi:hypothetical protein